MRVVRGWGLGLGVAFGRGHAQKHNPYISEAVFVGKYRHSKGPWLWHQQHSTARWLRCGCVGWIGCVENGSETRWTCCCPECGDHVRVSTVDCEVKRMSCQLLRWKGRPDHDSWSNARHRYDFDSLVQWFLLCWISFFFSMCLQALWVWCFYQRCTNDWKVGGEKCGLLWVTGNRGDVGTRKDLKFGSGMMKSMAVKGRVGHGL